MKENHLVTRDEIILLRISSPDDRTAADEVHRQLPDEAPTAIWCRSGDKVAVWPARYRERAAAEIARRGHTLDGAFLADSILPGSGPAWLVPEQRWSAAAMPWLLARQKVLAAAAAILLTVGLAVNRAAADVEDRVARLERERRGLISARTSQTTAADRLPAIIQIGAAVPMNAHLTGLTLDESAREVRLRGRAADYAAVSVLSSSLAAIPAVQAIRPGKAGLVKIQGKSVVEFSLELTLR